MSTSSSGFKYFCLGLALAAAGCVGWIVSLVFAWTAVALLSSVIMAVGGIIVMLSVLTGRETSPKPRVEPAE